MSEMVEYFKSLGFTTQLCVSSEYETWTNIESGVSVELYKGNSTFVLSVVDRMVHCTIGRCSFPNKAIPEFVRQISCHARIS